MFAPFTDSGTIVVDGVLASVYASPGPKVPVSHWLAHAAAWPLRLYHRSGLPAALAPLWASLCPARSSAGGAWRRVPLLCRGGGGGPVAAGSQAIDELHPWAEMLVRGMRADRLVQVVS